MLLIGKTEPEEARHQLAIREDGSAAVRMHGTEPQATARSARSQLEVEERSSNSLASTELKLGPGNYAIGLSTNRGRPVPGFHGDHTP